MDIWSFFELQQRTKTRLALCLFALELTLSAIEQKRDGEAEEVRSQKKKGKNLSYNSRPPEREGDVAIKVKRPAILWYSALLRARREASLATRSSGRKRVTKSEDLKTTLDGLRSRRRRDEEKVSYFCQRSWLVCWTFSSIWKCCRFMKRDIWFRVSKDVFFLFFISPASWCAPQSSASIRYVRFIVFYIALINIAYMVSARREKGLDKRKVTRKKIKDADGAAIVWNGLAYVVMIKERYLAIRRIARLWLPDHIVNNGPLSGCFELLRLTQHPMELFRGQWMIIRFSKFVSSLRDEKFSKACFIHFIAKNLRAKSQNPAQFGGFLLRPFIPPTEQLKNYVLDSLFSCLQNKYVFFSKL